MDTVRSLKECLLQIQDPYIAWGGKKENLDKAKQVATLRAKASEASAQGEFVYDTHEKPIEELLSA